MSRSRRSAGDGSVPLTLFGLDEDVLMQHKKRKKAQHEQPTVESAVEKVGGAPAATAAGGGGGGASAGTTPAMRRGIFLQPTTPFTAGPGTGVASL